MHLDDLAARFLRGPGTHVVGRQAAGFHRGPGLPGRSGAAQASLPVHEQAGAAESRSLFELGKDPDPHRLRHGVEVTLKPADSAAFPVLGAVHDGDLPLVHLHRAAEDVAPAVTDRAKLLILARMAASLPQELVAMQTPVSRATTIERPRHPSILSSIGPASFLINAMPASMLPGIPLNVVERAYMAHSFGRGSARSGTAGCPCLLPSTRGRQTRGGVSRSRVERSPRHPSPGRDEREPSRARSTHGERTRVQDGRGSRYEGGVGRSRGIENRERNAF